MECTIARKPKTVEDLVTIKGWGAKTIANYGVDVISIIQDPTIDIPVGATMEMIDSIKTNTPALPCVMVSTPDNDIVLNDRQAYAFKTICGGKSVLLSGEAGTGKTEIIKKFHRDYFRRLKIGLTSTTGTSALLMGGTTLHSYLGIGLGNGSVDYLVSMIRGREYLKKRWNDLDVLVIDEVSMLNPELFDKLDKIGRSIRGQGNEHKRGLPWGGIQLILSGDFLQLPVVGSDKFTFEAESWGTTITETIVLTENVRQSGDDVWSRILSGIRVGIVTTEANELLSARVGVKVGDCGIIPTKLYSKNVDVDRVNDEALDRLAVDDPDIVFNEYEMNAIKMVKKKVNDATVDGYKKKCIAPEVIQLCVGAQVMLLVNKIDLGLSNGSRGVVVTFSSSSQPVVSFSNGVTIEIEKHDFQVNNGDGTVEFVLNQLPLKIAYAISIHKSQGITLDCAEVDIRTCFCEGQAYVAMSRVKRLDGLSIVGEFIPESVNANQKCIDFYEGV
jgi:ATP-dependent DNA helicase PIF1